jgi:homoserine O-succinyltransferase
MPIVIAGGRIPPRWAERNRPQAVISIDSYERRADCLRIAFINNMPDPALEDTEIQFFELLDATAGNIPVCLKLYTLPGIPRAQRGQQYLDSFYFDFDDLWNSRFDAVIVTGTEPHTSDLRDEAYWPIMAELLDWAERNTVSAVLSCLAAHASVLHSDGIQRHRLSDKRSGVYDFIKASDHSITSRTVEPVRFPHSRWNEVREDELTACGYVVLAKSAEAGVDSFAKRKKNSLFVHFQGHPEYGAQTLLKEYRRDIKRFLRAERETYPSMPNGYFDSRATKLLAAFQNNALLDPCEEVIENFPEGAVVRTLQNHWSSSARCIYSNWLEYISGRKAGDPVVVSGVGFHSQTERRRLALPSHL